MSNTNHMYGSNNLILLGNHQIQGHSCEEKNKDVFSIKKLFNKHIKLIQEK